MINKRRTLKEEVVLLKNGIEWISPFGYVKDWDGESGKPCTLEEVLSYL